MSPHEHGLIPAKRTVQLEYSNECIYREEMLMTYTTLHKSTYTTPTLLDHTQSHLLKLSLHALLSTHNHLTSSCPPHPHLPHLRFLPLYLPPQPNPHPHPSATSFSHQHSNYFDNPPHTSPSPPTLSSPRCLYTTPPAGRSVRYARILVHRERCAGSIGDRGWMLRRLIRLVLLVFLVGFC